MLSLIFIILLSLSLILNFLLGYCLVNLLRKFEIYETWVADFRKEIKLVYDRLKGVDEKNLFEKDDDVGFVFSELVRIMKEFNEKIR